VLCCRAMAPPRVFGRLRQGADQTAGRTVIKSGVECLMAYIDELTLLTGNPEHFGSKNASYG
jgi:hypothetical protein